MPEDAAFLPDGARIWVGGHNVAVRSRLNAALPSSVRPATGPLDAILIAPNDPAEWAYFLEKHLPRLSAAGVVCLAIPSPQEADPDYGAAADRFGLCFDRSFAIEPALPVQWYRRR